jgi:hypothetical protein
MKARQNGAGVTLPDTLRTQYMHERMSKWWDGTLRNQFFFLLKN